MLKLNTIIVPTDFSKPADYALEVAGSLARDHGAKLVILHTAPTPVYTGEIVVPLPEIDYKEMAWASFHRLEEIDPKMRELRVETVVCDGDPVREIIREARERNADMIVMGTHGRTGVRRLLMGSVAEAVLRRASCPVLTVKSPVLLSKEAPVETAEAAAKG